MVVSRDKLKLFLDDIIEVYKKHGITIGHEDPHGAFEFNEYQGEDDDNVKWITQALEWIGIEDEDESEDL